jgi:hypothetical protein
MKGSNTVAVLMTVRDEEAYIDLNISYHLDLGFDYFFVANHCSADKTSKILESYKNDPRVVVIEEKDPKFDHAAIANKLLGFANQHRQIDWFIFLDADEFLSIRDGSIHEFVERLESNGIPYATIGWANALFDQTLSDYTCSAVHPVDTTKYYLPWPEKTWQRHGHFRKALVKNHAKMEIVVGGHYVRTENNPEFFGEYHWNPFIVPDGEARLLHFEFRDSAEAIYKKWATLASFENDSTSGDQSPWLERIETIKRYVRDYNNRIDEVSKRWFFEHRTFWGTIIPDERIVHDTRLSLWYGKYFRGKLQRGEVKSVCLVRSGHLGDVVMTEPVARFLLKYVERVSLATKVEGAESLFTNYSDVYEFDRVNSSGVNSDIKIKLMHEMSDNRRSYIQGYLESAGFGEVELKDIPVLRDDWKNIVDGEYILIAPFTSSWEEKKRNWGYDKFVELSKLLEEEYGIQCVLLEKRYSLSEMMSLIRHCKFFVGNDAGPGVIAQSFHRNAYILFGATRPEHLHLSKHTVPVYDRNRHKLCVHKTRKEEIDCCEEFCMERITVGEVFQQIKLHE